MFLGTSSSACSNNYSIMVYLNNGNWYCVGSSGRKGEYATFNNGVSAGCFQNP
jgi:hypothetical protein